SPNNQSRCSDLGEPVPDIGKLLGVRLTAAHEVIQMLAVRQHVAEPTLDQLFGEAARIVNEDVKHPSEVLERRRTIQRTNQLDAFRGLRRERAHAARTATHQNKFTDPLWIG